jgi:hypothetical protein
MREDVISMNIGRVARAGRPDGRSEWDPSKEGGERGRMGRPVTGPVDLLSYPQPGPLSFRLARQKFIMALMAFCPASAEPSWPAKAPTNASRSGAAGRFP